MTSNESPAGITVDESPGRLRMTYRWRSIEHVVLTVGGMLMLGVFAYRFAAGEPASLRLLIPGIAFAIVGLPGFVNRTSIDLDHTTLVIRRGPLPSFCRRKQRLPAVRSVRYHEYSVHAVFNRRYYNAVSATLDDEVEIELYRVEQDKERARWVHDRLAEFIRRVGRG